MVYVGNITLPANTPATNPVREPIKVIKGLVYQVEFLFPPGCCGLAHVVVNDGGFQVWPSTPGTDFACDDFTISFPDTYLKSIDPIEFQIYGYNEDETYEHTIQVRIGMVDKDVFIGRFLPSYGYVDLIRMIDKMENMQAEQRKELLANPFSWVK